MTTSWARDRRFNQALLASIALHLLLAMLVPATVLLSGPTTTIETISFVHIMHMQVIPPRPVERQVRAVAPLAAPVVHVAQPKSAIPSLRRSANHPLSRTTTLSSAPTVGAMSRDGSANAQPGASAAPVTAPQPVTPSEAPRARVGGYMPLGAEDPIPVLDPNVRTALGALNVHVTLVITVDENGHTKNVAFQPPLDAQTQSRILALLSNAEWDPAICGAGVPCEGRATITL